MTLRLDAAEAAKVAQSHDAAAEAIDGAAASAPATVDGGYGTGYLMDILAAVSQTAGELSVVNRGIGMQVRDTADDVGKSEAQIGADFAEVNRRIARD